MTPTRLRECLAVLDWTQRGLARLLDRHEGTVRRWARGTAQMPDDVAKWLETRAKHAERHPPPIRARDGDRTARGVVARLAEEAAEGKAKP